MTVSLDSNRKTVAITFDGVTGKTFTVRATNINDDKAHSSGRHNLETNDAGEAPWIATFPGDFSGDVDVEITGSDGSRDEGVISV